MKRYLAILLTVAGILLLWACDAQNLPTAPTPVASTPVAQAVTATPPPPPPPPPATATPQPAPATSAPATDTPVPTLAPTFTATEEASPTAVPQPTDTVAPAQPDTPTRVPPVATRPRPTRTPTATGQAANSSPQAEATGSPQLNTQPTVISEGPPLGPWSQVVKVAPGNKRIALTFDAGASGETWPQIMATLKERGIHITMFFTGKFAEQYPDAIKAAVADGHELGNHTYSHLDSRTLTDAQLINELSRTESIIQNLTGATTKPYWRPPYGAYNNHVLQVAVSQGYRSIYWTLDSLDSVGQPKTPDFIFNRVTNPPKGINLDGAIVLQHFGSQASADALPRELDTLKEMGYQVGTISQLLSP
jgi:peptidoglycan-N-acetylmuramic acid deacetylase